MKPSSLSHLADQALLRGLAALVAQDRSTTAAMLVHLAEVDARKLFLPAAYPSMYAWCVGELKLSEDVACKRIQAARVARRFPAIFPMLADGRLHLSAVILLAPHLTPEAEDELLAAAAKKPTAEVERLLAERFPRADLPTTVTDEAATISGGEHAPGHVGAIEDHRTLVPTGTSIDALPPGPVAGKIHHLAALAVRAPQSHAKVAPLSPGRFALQLTVGQDTHDKLRYAQARLGHAIPAGDLTEALDRALDALIRKLEQRRFAANARSRQCRSRREEGRPYVPAEVRRIVWRRDGGRCTFVSESGRRCAGQTRLEFDHIEPFARRGESTPHGLRLRSRAHKQYEAERAYGIDFMSHKRLEARRGAARCSDVLDAPLEVRVRAALSSLAPSGMRKVIATTSGLP